ncbi:hypothetical protein CONCODRAFT_12277 [Conidiobolus coronatus NRRL 28638]|uniref:Uncharacterized protein n=1 Tax=Conidiobolus coronatus (strain ATCC 28846 / CBS 209.66 / NRRL 28638) TaxID=796925 RepID=A0A137NTD3_CONC2|nr:hypothetical protein CONCODRAFT_12277 [Conidiobolus coronatus NRRL 28638]|eukprot:KXN65989.1 hypothetical protein CONCODRAFT_12277 [Conidiobolus coronatus NRRL 28638]
MYLERRGYCYSEYECSQMRQNRNIYLAIGICISLCSLLVGACRYFGRKKTRQTPQTHLSPAEIRTLASASTNTQAKTEESNEEQLPPYSGSNQGAQVLSNNLQNSSLPLYPAPPQDANNAQSGEYFAGGFAPPANSQSNANQSSPSNSDTPVSSPALNEQMGNLNNTDTIQYPAPVQATLSQRQTDTLNNSSTTNHDQNLNTQPATDNLTNNSTNPQSAQRS